MVGAAALVFNWLTGTLALIVGLPCFFLPNLSTVNSPSFDPVSLVFLSINRVGLSVSSPDFSIALRNVGPCWLETLDL